MFPAPLRKIPNGFLAGLSFFVFALSSPLSGGSQAPKGKPRVVVLTDISNEPDDEESLVRFLVYANEFEIEGLIATTSNWLKHKTREDILRNTIEAYGKVRERLLVHAPGFPAREQLLAATKTGQMGFGMAAVGEGKSTAGSKHLVEVVDRADERPVWVTIWGGANTLAQALFDVKATRDAAAVAKFASRIRAYAISDQDDAGRWIRTTFPDLFYIVSPSTLGSQEYWRATWTGISGDRYYKNGPMHRFELVDNPWLEENIIENHGPLGALYPRFAYIMEGDTPSFLGLIDNGLGWSIEPSYGGWGGRYALYQCSGESRPTWTDNADSRDTVTTERGPAQTSHQATIWRWREAYQNDFAARMDWCLAESYGQANHNPSAVLNGDRTKDVLNLSATAGETIALSAEGSSDPDGNTVRTKWWVYREAGSFRGELALSSSEGDKTSLIAPAVKKPETIHVILQLEDEGAPRLFAYRRAVITVNPSAQPGSASGN
jgi:hypothetical protein